MSLWNQILGRKAIAAPETKRSKTAPLIAMQSMGQAVWSPRDAATLARIGYERNVVVYRCIRMISEAAASVPLLLYNGRRELEGHSLLKLLERPNPRQAGPQFFENVFGHLLISGNAYIEAVTLGDDVRELYSLRPERMKLIAGRDGWAKAYEYSVNGETVRYDQEAGIVPPILHLNLFHPTNDHYGFAPLTAAQTPVDLHNAASNWNKALLDNSARPSGALVYAPSGGQTLTDEQYERLKEELETSYMSATNAGRPLLLEGGLDWKQLSLSPKDMDFIEAKNAAAREIALAFGVPPMLLGIPGDNTYANYVEANRGFWRQAVLPLLGRTTRSIAHWLAPVYGDVQLEYDSDAIDALSQDREALWKRVNDATFLTDEEKRAAVGYDDWVRRMQRRRGGVKGAAELLDEKYSPDQPRVPAGVPEGGQWVDDVAFGGDGVPSRAPIPRARPVRDGDNITGSNPEKRVRQDASNNPSFLPKGMKPSQIGKEYLAKYEKFSPTVYLDQAHEKTIGYGHKLLPGESFPNGLTQAEAWDLFEKDLAIHVIPIQRYVKVNLTQNQYDALASLMFNAGAEEFRNSRALRHLNAGNIEGFIPEFLDFNKITQNGKKVISRGLVNRRADDLEIFLYGNYKIKK